MVPEMFHFWNYGGIDNDRSPAPFVNDLLLNPSTWHGLNKIIVTAKAWDSLCLCSFELVCCVLVAMETVVLGNQLLPPSSSIHPPTSSAEKMMQALRIHEHGWFPPRD